MLSFADSLAQTVDAINAAWFSGQAISAAEAKKAAAMIASRYGQEGAYAGTFALFPSERKEGIRLFSGEKSVSASARHIVAQEACRALRILKPKDSAACAALTAAEESLARCVGPAAPGGARPDDGKQHWDWAYRGGTYCCGKCSVGFWRHLLLGGFDQVEKRLSRGLKCLRDSRKGQGQWQRFPFWYTISALVEMDPPAAREEMRYAAKTCEPFANRHSANTFSQRRSELARRLLSRV
jgi:hypothetical protein